MECVGPAISKMLSLQIRAVEGLTSAFKGKKVVYKTETRACPLLSPALFSFLYSPGGLEVGLMGLGLEEEQRV